MATAFRFRWVLDPAFSSMPSWPASLNAGCLQQFGQFLARIEQARLHSVLGYANDFGHLFHGLLVVVDQIDDFPMVRREARQTLPQRFTGILLLPRRFWI